jgi:hypothetical protein
MRCRGFNGTRPASSEPAASRRLQPRGRQGDRFPLRASAQAFTLQHVPVNVQYLDYEPLGFLSWGLREDGELAEQRAFGPDTPAKDTYAVYTLENEALRADFAYPWVIVGAIRPTSAMELGPTGFRCGDAEIVALARSPLWREDEKRAAERTAHRYGVPLVEFDRLAAVASEHGSPVSDDDRRPSGRDPPTEREDTLDAAGPVRGSPRMAPEAASNEPSPLPSAPRKFPSNLYANITPRRLIARRTFEPRRHGPLDWLAYCALGAALVAFGVGIWLLGRAGWPFASLLFLLPAAVVIALTWGRRLALAASGAMGGVIAALLYLLVAAGSGDTPEEAQVRFALLVVAWFVTATAFICAVLADRPVLEQLAALAAVVLPVGALVAVGLLGLSAGLAALIVAVVELASLGIWDQAINTRRA